ncbi:MULTISPECIES: hypothetical protein [Kitasatospora]|uniref:Uncharacterized protein n=1 Tax=Kitasatospora cystarginea TaxID=58350 RepID=A0ABN3EUI6_9ACTN
MSGRLGQAHALLKGAFMRATVNYGFSPIRVLFALGLLEVAGGVLFSMLRDDIHLTSTAASAHQVFQPWLYTLDLLLPVVNLHQRDLVVAHSAAMWCSTGFTIVGWALGTALVVGVGSALKGADR